MAIHNRKAPSPNERLSPISFIDQLGVDRCGAQEPLDLFWSAAGVRVVYPPV